MARQRRSPTDGHGATTMNASQWMYIGEGGKHAVFGYRGGGDDKKWSGSVLRIPKDVLVVAPAGGSDSVTANDCNSPPDDGSDPLYYIRDVIKPLLGHYVDVPEVVELDWTFLALLREQTLSDGIVPASRMDQWNILSHGPYNSVPVPKAHLLRNYRYSEEGVSSITVEIKPKAGYKAFSPLVDSLNRVKFSKTRFEILQKLHCTGYISKGWDQNNHSIVEPSSYCPIDLFSKDTNDVMRAVSNMIETPQNNLRVWFEDTLLLGHDSSEVKEVLFLKAIQLLSSQNECTVEFGSYRALFSQVFATLVSTVLLKEELLDKLLTLQRLDVVDADGAILVYERLRELCGDEADEILDSPSPLRTAGNRQHCILRKSPFRKPLDCPALDSLVREIEYFSLRLDTAQPSLVDLDASLERCKCHVGSLSREACVLLLKNWLLSLAMCDISFFLQLCPINSFEDLNEFGLGMADCPRKSGPKVDEPCVVRCQTERSPGVLVTKERAFTYTLKVVDCDRKPAKKLRTRRDKEATIRFYKEE